VGFVYVDGSSVGDVTETLLKDRRVLGEEGFISIFAAVDMVDSKVVAGPEIHARGLGLADHEFEPILEKVREILESALREGQNDPHDLQQRVRREVGKWVSTLHRRRPMIVPVVIEA
jgi:ribonuclease J